MKSNLAFIFQGKYKTALLALSFFVFYSCSSKKAVKESSEDFSELSRESIPSDDFSFASGALAHDLELRNKDINPVNSLESPSELASFTEDSNFNFTEEEEPSVQSLSFDNAPVYPHSSYSYSPSKKMIIKKSFLVDGDRMNRFGILKSTELSWSTLSKSIYGSSDYAEALKLWNNGSELKAGRVFYFQSPIQKDTLEMKHYSFDYNSTGYEEYTVQRGDSLSLIAKRNLGSLDGWKELSAINQDIEKPDFIEIGQKINIPSSGKEISNYYGFVESKLKQLASNVESVDKGINNDSFEDDEQHIRGDKISFQGGVADVTKTVVDEATLANESFTQELSSANSDGVELQLPEQVTKVDLNAESRLGLKQATSVSEKASVMGTLSSQSNESVAYSKGPSSLRAKLKEKLSRAKAQEQKKMRSKGFFLLGSFLLFLSLFLYWRKSASH